MTLIFDNREDMDINVRSTIYPQPEHVTPCIFEEREYNKRNLLLLIHSQIFLKAKKQSQCRLIATDEILHS
jgi:hypothetical protein